MMTDGALRIALIGTRGVPARYGGFETCVEEIGWRLVEKGHHVLVTCHQPRNSGEELPTHYRGMRLEYFPVMRRRALETPSSTRLASKYVSSVGADAAIVFNAANAPFVPRLRRAGIPVATHVDGLEWRRGKWGRAGQQYYLMAERLAVRWSDALIADAPGIAQYYRDKFDVGTVQIAYGAPITDGRVNRLGELDLQEKKYHLVVARFEPENHVDVIVEGYSRSGAKYPLIVVGSAPYADEHTTRIHELADGRVRFLGGLWDQELLDQLYTGALTYLHGHSVGGTNPSLLRAIGAGAAVGAFDVNFNRDVVGDAGWYFASPADVARLVDDAEADPADARRRSKLSRQRAADYTWDDVADRYEEMCRALAGGGKPGS